MRIHKGLRRLIVNAVSPRARAARIARFEAIMQPYAGMRVLDIGGLPTMWRFLETPLDITIVNLDIDQIRRREVGGHRFTIVQGDGTALDFPDGAFDLVFSNSTIEHVGPPDSRAAFAREVRRLAPAFFVQTPSIAFPVEAHTGLPFWWRYPEPLRVRLIARWRRRDPVFGDFVAGTAVVRRRELQALFPDGTLIGERILGITKSHSIYRLPTVG